MGRLSSHEGGRMTANHDELYIMDDEISKQVK